MKVLPSASQPAKGSVGQFFASRDKMFAAGDALNVAAGKLAQALQANNDADLKIAAAAIEQSATSVRLGGLRFLADKDVKWVKEQARSGRT